MVHLELGSMNSLESLHYALTHVFLPVDLPDHNDYSLDMELSLLRAVCIASHAYSAQTSEPRWNRVTRMLEKLHVSFQSERLNHDYVISELRAMQPGDILIFYIHRLNAAIFLTKRGDFTLFEPFEVSPREDAVERSSGSLVCLYPWSAVEVPDAVFYDQNFQSEFANFLSPPNDDGPFHPAPPAAQPQYVTALLSGILRSVGRASDVPSVIKRIRDHVGRPPDQKETATDDQGVWRRSPLWLLVRVAVQMSMDRSASGRTSYKRFLLFFICTIAENVKDECLTSSLLHLIASKILRRLSKLGPAVPSWLSEVGLGMCAHLQKILDAERRMQLQSTRFRPFSFRNPSLDELARDTGLSLPNSRKRIRDALQNHHREPLSLPFPPNHHRRGTIHDFLSPGGANFFDDAYNADPDITLYDIECCVEHDIDQWLSHVTSVEDACAELEILMDRYMVEAHIRPSRSPEDYSISALTMLELFVALDKLVIEEIPMLAEYSPEIPMAFLETLLLRKATSLHRLSRVYQHLCMRHTQSCPGWSVFQDEFTEDSFPVRYYDRSPHVQCLKELIEQETPELLSTLAPLHAKVVVFESQSPTCFRIWRSAAPRILYYLWNPFIERDPPTTIMMKEHDLLAHFPPLLPYFVSHERIPLSVQVHLASFHCEGSQYHNCTKLCYTIQYPKFEEDYTEGYGLFIAPGSLFSLWPPAGHHEHLYKRTYAVPGHCQCTSCGDLVKCINYTSHTSNDVLATLVKCPTCLSLEEFITSAHLRSGCLLQWVNILQGLRSRTLNFRRHHVHYLLCKAVLQVGPLDLKTGTWIWHHDLLDLPFCEALLEELDSLFMDAAAGSIDGMMMNTISLLLTRVLASSPSEGISQRIITLLQSVRRKTFSWVQELSYNLAKAPTKRERVDLLLDMAATCRSTFDVDSATLPKLFQSAEDIDAALSCFLLIHALRPQQILAARNPHTMLLLQRDRRLSFALEEILGNIILCDTSHYGVDLAARKVFVGYRPSVYRWAQLQQPNSRWFACRTKATLDRPSQVVHFNLLDGTFQVDGQPIGGLPPGIRDDRRCQEIFRDQGFFVVPSDLPGMDFTTFSGMSKHKVHFSLRDDGLLLRAQGPQSSDILELIPATELLGDLPPELLLGHVHWLNPPSKTIEIRPLEQLWVQSAQNWRIDCRSRPFRAYRGVETLVGIHSPTWARVSKHFKRFNVETFIEPGNPTRNLLITTSPVDPLQSSMQTPRLSVTLPRFGLSFFVNAQGEFESHDFKDMVYDEDHCIGALSGLNNLLVLRQKDHLAEGLIPKLVFIPNASFIDRGDFRVRVQANNHSSFSSPDSEEPLYYIYNVDTELGCLVGDGSPLAASIQHLARLHAMTSCEWPDSLTSKTGAQAALHLFNSAGSWSIMKRDTIKPSLWEWKTPYPQVEAVYAGIKWYSCHGSPGFWYRTPVGDAHKRAMWRATYLFPWSATATILEDHEDTDHDYPMLDTDLELESVAFTAASTIQRWLTDAPTMGPILDWVAMWGRNSTCVDTTSELAFFLPAGSAQEELFMNPGLVQTIQDALETEEGTHRRFRLLFLLPAIAYCSSCNQAAFLSMLVAFAERLEPHSLLRNPSLSKICSTWADDCQIFDGYRPTEEDIARHFREVRLKPEQWYTQSDIEKYMVGIAVKCLLKDWPSNVPPSTLAHKINVEGFRHDWDWESLIANLQRLFSSCCRNFKLKEHLLRFLVGPRSSTPLRPTLSLANECVPWQISLDQLISSRTAPELPSRTNLLRDAFKPSRNDISQINRLLFSISKTPLNSSLQKDYIALLQKSAQSEEYTTAHRLPGEDHVYVLERHYAQCRTGYYSALAILKETLGPTTNPHQQALSQFGQWPPITGDVLLRCLASTSPMNLPQQWKRSLVSLALLLLDLQRARRLLRYALDGLEEEFSRELENEGCDGWDPEEYPDWLLIQVQGNFLIRRTQAEIAMEMMSPRSDQNIVVQAKMGEGKSSVIIPIMAAALANGNQLVRVITPKALSAQMFQLLVSRLGGLANRPIYYLPFSRLTHLTGNEHVIDIDNLQKVTHLCMVKRGILLVHPEHVASLKLKTVEEQIRKGEPGTEDISGIRKSLCTYVATALSLRSLPADSLVGDIFRQLVKPPTRSSPRVTTRPNDGHTGDNADKEPDNASKWLSHQTWLQSHVRDILDESDEVLHPRFQLIYTVGLPQHVDGFAARWTITQSVLRLVKKHMYSLSRYAPDLVEYESGLPGWFPQVQILRPSEVGRYLTSSIVEDVVAGQLPGFEFQGASAGLQDAIRSFISDEDVFQVPDTVKRVEEYAKLCSQTGQVWKGLLLLRGLLSSNVVLSALAERRWRVDYGLVLPSQYTGDSQTSTMLAVPYRAKDLPAPNTHFGHPDITIILTCLSYYYGGLDEKRLRASFELLLDSEDDPSAEYALWVQEHDCSSLPDSLRTLNEINLKSSEQWDKIVRPLFARNQAAIDFYLSRVVFPKEMKEYPWKLRSSSWDLAEKREKLITGFSGTNDCRWLLPMSITQRDLSHQQGTNAKILAYLLQPENDAYAVTHESGQQQSTATFLRTIAVQQPEIRVLLDVGAQVLDISNRQVAQAWLSMLQQAAGAIFFNKNNELMVLMRNGTTVPLLSSSLSRQLDRCVVYIDHAHTRGTDIKLPIGLRAAVTLGPKVTKDCLVQGCMRMRMLGRGHSVMFFAPPEVDRSIRSISGKEDLATRVTTVDILSWAINETCADIERRAPYWAQQGMDHKIRYDAWAKFVSKKMTKEELADAWLQPEVKSLADLYAPCEAQRSSRSLSRLDPEIRQRCKNLGVLSLPNAEMAEEIEREVGREREREREVELPPKAEPAKHYLHPDVIEFVKTGNIPPRHASSTFHPVFSTLEKTSAATPEVDVWSPSILATTDFCKTIEPESTQGTIDQYLRPVQWVLTRQGDHEPLLVLLSPFEANQLVPDIRVSERVRLHLYVPRTSLRMKPSDDLRLYTIPPLPCDWIPPWALIDQLNIFAGQLYLRDYETYLRVCQFLGVPTNESGGDSSTGVQWNLFNLPGGLDEHEIRFSSSPMPCVMALLSIRSRGRSFAHTHMGHILQGRLLMPADFEDRRTTAGR